MLIRATEYTECSGIRVDSVVYDGTTLKRKKYAITLKVIAKYAITLKV